MKGDRMYEWAIRKGGWLVERGALTYAGLEEFTEVANDSSISLPFHKRLRHRVTEDLVRKARLVGQLLAPRISGN
jgi:hypothetical protein